MAYENIQVRKQNFTTEDGYFYTFDHDQDNLVVKTDDGNTAFSYPLDTTISYEVVSLEYDGFNFWTLERKSDGFIIRRWQIHNYVCVLKNTFTYTNSPSHTYSSYAMTVEHYHFAFSADEATGQNVLSTYDPEGIISNVGNKISSGMTVRLGPSSNPAYKGQYEEFSVVSATSDSITINGNTSIAYKSGDPITTYKYIWVFNDYNGTNGSEGAIYKFDAYTGSYITKYPGGEYKGIRSCTFAVIPDGLPNKVNSLCYVKGSNMLFKNVDTMSNYGSMAMDNIEQDDATIIPIYDLAIEHKNVYRLQRKATYYGQTYTFSNNLYSYQLATLIPFVHSISLTADPAVIPADSGVSSSQITAIVKSQFLLPISGRIVTFSDDDSVGYLSTTSTTTNSDGEAYTTYFSGDSAREVKITATAKQS